MLEGSEALLKCEITNLAGSVQWVKDGFALGMSRRFRFSDRFFLNNWISFGTGFSEKIPGYPRYTMIGDRSYGIFNLRIQNASLEDDAEFQCQVGPAKNSDPIRTAANLTVICKYQLQEALLPITTPGSLNWVNTISYWRMVVSSVNRALCQYHKLMFIPMLVTSRTIVLLQKPTNTLFVIYVCDEMVWPRWPVPAEDTKEEKGKENRKPKRNICAVRAR